jgi:addiction module HigA family antidote
VIRLAFAGLADETVTAAAKRLGVSRVALQRLVTGKADLSPAMALKVERVYGVPAEGLVEMQARYDLAKALGRARTALAQARAK